MKAQIAIFTLLFCFLAIALNANPIHPNTNGKWSLMTVSQDIQIYYKNIEHHNIKNGLHTEILIFKFINTSKQNIELNWFRKTWVNGKYNNYESSNNPEHYFKLQLNARETIVGEARIDTPNISKLFVRFLNKDNFPIATNFDFFNLTNTPRI